jgi:hypothetical protein
MVLEDHHMISPHLNSHEIAIDRRPNSVLCVNDLLLVEQGCHVVVDTKFATRSCQDHGVVRMRMYHAVDVWSSALEGRVKRDGGRRLSIALHEFQIHGRLYDPFWERLVEVFKRSHPECVFAGDPNTDVPSYGAFAPLPGENAPRNSDSKRHVLFEHWPLPGRFRQLRRQSVRLGAPSTEVNRFHRTPPRVPSWPQARQDQRRSFPQPSPTTSDSFQTALRKSPRWCSRRDRLGARHRPLHRWPS